MFKQDQMRALPGSSESPAEAPEDAESPLTEFIDEYIDESGDRRVGISEDIDEDGHYEHGLPANWFSWRKLWLFMGPGFLMSIAYLVRIV